MMMLLKRVVGDLIAQSKIVKCEVRDGATDSIPCTNKILVSLTIDNGQVGLAYLLTNSLLARGHRVPPIQD